MTPLISRAKSIIVSLDVDSLEALRKLVTATHLHPVVSGYKVGLELVIPFGLTQVVAAVKELTDKPVIYDMQKGATDIPELGPKFARACKRSGVDSVILFPMTGPKTERAWIDACGDAGLHVMVGGEMTHPGYLNTDGGWIDASRLDWIYQIALDEGVNDFVVPGNKPERIAHYRALLGPKAVFYSPGLVTQGGSISDSATAAGEFWHAIVGRAVYLAQDPWAVVEELALGLR